MLSGGSFPFGIESQDTIDVVKDKINKNQL